MKAGGRRTRAVERRECPVLRAWEATVRRQVGQRAMVEAASGTSCTFAELDRRANALLAANADLLAGMGGRAVAFAAPNGIGWMALFLALVRADAVVLPIDASEPPAAQRRIAEGIGAGAWWDGTRFVRLEVARPRAFPGARLIKLTSGTTGEPRPLVFTGEQLLADARQVTATMGIGKREVNYALIPFGHSYGLGNLTLPLIAQGVPVVGGSAALPQVIATEIAQWGATVFPSVPAVFRALVAAGLDGDAFPGLRLPISAGAPLSPEVALAFEARFGRRIHNFYGSSETGGIAYDRAGAATLAGGVGRPMRGVEITPTRGGRIEVRSAAVFTHRNPRRRGGWGCWVPPDLVRIDARGQITLLGRRGSTVKIGGRRLSLAEVAARIRGLNGVRDVWVGVAPGVEPLLGAAVCGGRSPAELRAQLLADTAPWKVPRKLIVLPEFPLTGRGKTDTRALQRAVFGAARASCP